MLQVEHRVAEVDVAVDLPDYHVDCIAVDLLDCYTNNKSPKSLSIRI